MACNLACNLGEPDGVAAPLEQEVKSSNLAQFSLRPPWTKCARMQLAGTGCSTRYVSKSMSHSQVNLPTPRRKKLQRKMFDFSGFLVQVGI